MAGAVARERTQCTTKAIGLVMLRDLLGQGRWWSSEELARILERDQRTIQRWILDMDALGCPVVTDREMGCPGNAFRYRRFEG